MAMLQEWLNLIVRWAHVIAAIMWIGDSFLFMWLDSHLTSPTKPREGQVTGELWMTHSGGFYEVVKHKSLEKLPAQLYWFKWESYTTWITGFLLLLIVYHLQGAAFLIDANVMALEPWQAMALSLGLLPVAVLVYDLLWRTPLAKDGRVMGVVGFALLLGLTYFLTHVFSGRGAFLQVGAVVGTIMASNVFFRIIPSQKHMIAATAAGTPVDTSYGLRAKGRSVQNHYLTLPVLFTMLSNHFPSTYSHQHAWVVLGLLFIFGAGLKYVMNFRRKSHPAVLMATFFSLGGVVIMTMPEGPSGQLIAEYKKQPPVSFATVNAIMQARCVSCHAAKTTNPTVVAAPSGIMFDTPEGIGAHADRIFMRAVQTKTMPLGNMTQMTIPERELLGAWYAQGADIHAPGPVAMPGVPASADGGEPQLPPAEEAKERFATACVACHGEKGDGKGMSAAALAVKPRNYTDPEWQKSVTDEQIRTIILKGGEAVGKSAIMPSNEDLEEKPLVVDELVKIVRGFGQPK